MRRSIGCLALGLSLTLGACGGSDEETARKDDDEQAVVATKSDAELSPWLAHTDPMDTGRWLASREAGRLVANDDGASAQMRRSLGRAKSFFIEDDRMIANRTVQLGAMLGGIGKSERFETLIGGLTRVAQGARGKQLYGEMCHHYFNTRQQGADSKAAFAKLAERYATQRRGDETPVPAEEEAAPDAGGAAQGEPGAEPSGAKP